MRNQGFTLIEVLIALAIISIALTAILKVSGQAIRDTQYVQQKIIAMWVGGDVMRAIHVGLLHPPSAPDKLTDTTELVGQRLAWEAEKKPTPNPRIQQITVDVMQPNKDTPLLQLTGYLYDQA